MTQPTYGQVPNGQPQYPASPAPEQYQPQAYPQAQNYQPYSAMAQPYATAPSSQSAKKSPVLGILGLGIVAICAVIFFLCSMSLYNVIFESVGSDAVGSNGGWLNFNTDSMTASQMENLTIATVGLLITTVLGIVGLVLSIIATAKNMGRPPGIVGIILGILAPGGFFLAAIIAVSSYT